LWFGPAVIAQGLHIFIGGAIRCLCHSSDILKQGALCRRQIGLIEIAVSDSLYSCFFRSLNTQEVCMRVQSIWAAVEVRNPAGNCFLGLAGQMTL
jgi:hypothetical protein